MTMFVEELVVFGIVPTLAGFVCFLLFMAVWKWSFDFLNRAPMHGVGAALAVCMLVSGVVYGLLFAGGQ